MADSSTQVALYASVGPQLTHYAVDIEGARSGATGHRHLAGQYPLLLAARASGRHLYVASSDSASGIAGWSAPSTM